MRFYAALFALVLGLNAVASAQTCTGLCQQQVSCPSGATTSISGTIYAPNGTDPLPNVLVYIPNAPVDAFTPGVSCPVVGQPPSGSPLVGTTTAVDGTFTLTNVPVGTNIPLVIQSGRWRRQLVVPGTAACTSTSFSTRFARNQTEGDIPKIALATGSADQVECVLRKVGIDDSEFTDPGGPGRISMYAGSFSPGAVIDSNTPSEDTLMGKPQPSTPMTCSCSLAKDASTTGLARSWPTSSSSQMPAAAFTPATMATSGCTTIRPSTEWPTGRSINRRCPTESPPWIPASPKVKLSRSGYS